MKINEINDILASIEDLPETMTKKSIVLSNAASMANASRWSKPGASEKLSAKLKETLADPRKRAAISERVSAHWQDKAQAEKKAEGMRRAYCDPEVIKRKSEALKKAFQDPIKKQRLIDGVQTPEARAKKSAASKAMHDAARAADPELMARYLEREAIKERKATIGKFTHKGEFCTIDGVQIFSGMKLLQRVLGAGKSGSRSPNFRYLTAEETAAAEGKVIGRDLPIPERTAPKRASPKART